MTYCSYLFRYSGSGLASVFGNAGLGGDGNPSLTYTAPKQPKKASSKSKSNCEVMLGCWSTDVQKQTAKIVINLSCILLVYVLLSLCLSLSLSLCLSLSLSLSLSPSLSLSLSLSLFLSL